MTERSRFWNSTTPGDASEAPYDAPTEFAQVLMALGGQHNLAGRSSVMYTHQGLLPSVPGANTLRVAAGTALVYGSWYENDSTIDVNIPTPASATRNDRVVIRKNWATQTVRVTRIAGTEGGGIPALTQVIGTTWDMYIARVAITTGGVMTLTDERQLSARDFMVCEEFTLPNNGIRRVLLDEAVFGGLLVVCTDAGTIGVFGIRGGVNSTVLGLDLPAGSFSAALTTASRVNVGFAGGIEYQIENKLGTERRFRVFLIRGF